MLYTMQELCSKELLLEIIFKKFKFLNVKLVDNFLPYLKSQQIYAVRNVQNKIQSKWLNL